MALKRVNVSPKCCSFVFSFFSFFFAIVPIWKPRVHVYTCMLVKKHTEGHSWIAVHFLRPRIETQGITSQPAILTPSKKLGIRIHAPCLQNCLDFVLPRSQKEQKKTISLTFHIHIQLQSTNGILTRAFLAAIAMLFCLCTDHSKTSKGWDPGNVLFLVFFVFLTSTCLPLSFLCVFPPGCVVVEAKNNVC